MTKSRACIKRAIAVALLVPLATIGCGPREQKITISGESFTVPAAVPADKVANPVEILQAAGGIPENGSMKGEYRLDGHWVANGRFPSSPENESVGAYVMIQVLSFPSREAMDKFISGDGSVISMTDDGTKVLIGRNKPFFAIITAMASVDGPVFDVDVSQVAARIDAELRP